MSKHFVRHHHRVLQLNVQLILIDNLESERFIPNWLGAPMLAGGRADRPLPTSEDAVGVLSLDQIAVLEAIGIFKVDDEFSSFQSAHYDK